MAHKTPKPTFFRTALVLVSLMLAGVFARPALPAGATGTEQPAAAAPVLTPQANLDNLFARLAAAQSPQEAQGITSAIERLWLRSGSDTADLLMGRVLQAMGKNQHDLALNLLDQIVALEPEWAEGWNKRATVRFLESDDSGSVADIARVLALEPRHYGALAGLGMILQRNGQEKRALQVFRRTLEVDPQLGDIRKMVDKMIPEVEGREL